MKSNGEISFAMELLPQCFEILSAGLAHGFDQDAFDGLDLELPAVPFLELGRAEEALRLFR